MMIKIGHFPFVIVAAGKIINGPICRHFIIGVGILRRVAERQRRHQKDRRREDQKGASRRASQRQRESSRRRLAAIEPARFKASPDRRRQNPAGDRSNQKRCPELPPIENSDPGHKGQAQAETAAAYPPGLPDAGQQAGQVK